MRPANSFLTLTYDQQHVPQDYSVKLDDFQKFMKRLRKSVSPSKIRFFACGEYGDQNLRPHYHALIFNHNFPDKKFITTRNGNNVYSSQSLHTLWPQGSHEIGDVTFKSAAYTARYVLKKQTGDQADDHYMRRSPIDGELYRVATEFCVQSKGLGQAWFDKYKSDAFPCDFLIVDGRKVKPPRFYLNQLKEDDRDRAMRDHNEKYKIQQARRDHGRAHKTDNTPERLEVRARVQDLKLKLLPRKL